MIGTTVGHYRILEHIGSRVSSRAKELAAQYASEAASKTGLKGSAAMIWSILAQSAAAFDDTGAARASVRTSLDIERNAGTLLNSAYALAIIDDRAGAQKLVDEAVKLPGASHPDAQRGLTFINALIRLRQGDRRALDSVPAPQSETDFGPIFAIGVAHLTGGDPQIAAQQFKRIVDRPEPSASSLKPLASLYYARALAKLGNIDESRKTCGAFFDAWKNADANLPVLLAAKQEYSRLKS